MASYILLEFYVEGFALTALDGDMINGEPFIGWLNYIFDKRYTNQRESGLWAAPILKAGTPVSKEILSSSWSVVEPLPTEKFIHRTGNAGPTSGRRMGMWNSPRRCGCGWQN